MEGERMQVLMPQLEDKLRSHLTDCEKEESRWHRTYLCMLFTLFTSRLTTSLKSKKYDFFG
jgi:hypothetical protein